MGNEKVGEEGENGSEGWEMREGKRKMEMKFVVPHLKHNCGCTNG